MRRPCRGHGFGGDRRRVLRAPAAPEVRRRHLPPHRVVRHAPAALRLAQASPAIPSDSARRALSAAEHRRTPSWLQRAPPPRARGEAAKRAPFCNPPARRRRSAGAAGGVLRARLRVAHAQTRRRSCMRAGAQRPARAARLTGQAPRCCCARPRSHEKPGAGGRGRMHTAASAASADDSQAHSLKEKAEREDKRSRSLRMQVPFVRVLVGDGQCTNSSPPSPFSCSLAFSLCRTVCPSLTLSLPHAHMHTHLPSLCRVSLSHSLPPSRTHSRSFLLCLSQTARPPPRSLLLSRSLSLSRSLARSLSLALSCRSNGEYVSCQYPAWFLPGVFYLLLAYRRTRIMIALTNSCARLVRKKTKKKHDYDLTHCVLLRAAGRARTHAEGW